MVTEESFTLNSARASWPDKVPSVIEFTSAWGNYPKNVFFLHSSPVCFAFSSA
jgi:hypothetical protein